MKLYSYWRSSAAYRVRIALNLKGLDHTIIPVSLVGDSPEHRSESYRALNPQMLLPFLIDGSVQLGQSQAILEYLEEAYGDVPLLPESVQLRAAVRSFCGSICSDIHPLNNLRVLKYLSDKIGASETQVDDWYSHWIHAGFASAEQAALQHSADGKFVFGDAPTLADVCLIPQVYNALRWEVELDEFELIRKIALHCGNIPGFHLASPAMQPDAKP